MFTFRSIAALAAVLIGLSKSLVLLILSIPKLIFISVKLDLPVPPAVMGKTPDTFCASTFWA